MRKLLPYLLLAAACGSSTAQQPAPADPAAADPAAAPAEPVAAPAPAAPVGGTPRYDARTFYDTVAIDGASFSHDGTRILTSLNRTGVFNVYSIPVAGGEPTQLTQSTTDFNHSVSYFPGDDRYLYEVDAGGNELTHIWVAELDGTRKDLTPGDKLKAVFIDWSRDKKAFYIATNERDPKFFDLYRYTTDKYQRTLLFQNDGGWMVVAVSPDERWIALTKDNNNADTDIYLADRKAKPKKKGAPVAPALITRDDGMVQNQPLAFSPDGKKLLYTSDGAGEFTQARSYDLKTGKQATEATSAWDVVDYAFSENGRYRVTVTNEDARTVLAIAEAKTGTEVKPKELPPGDITGAVFDLAEKQMAFFLSSDRAPADLYVVDLATGAPRRLTTNLSPKVDPANLVDAQVVRYHSFDDREVPALLYKPRDASPTAKVPALVLVHGGPGGQSRLGYSALTQFLVNHGYGVIAVNNRGSSGYGKTFFHLDDKKHGDVDLKDCVWARHYLESLDWVDGKHIAIMGGSYGGYMVAAALAFEPDAFDAGVDIFGVTNWLRTLESIPPWWTSFRDALYAEMGDPKQDKERLTAHSPLFHAQNIKKPLLVVQGKNDPRVLKVESDELVAAVKKNGVPVDYVVFDDEGHGFLKKDNQIAAAEKIVAFLDKHLARGAAQD